MKQLLLTSMCVLFSLVCVGLAEPTDLSYEDGPQDPLWVPNRADELGLGFPPDELISSDWYDTTETACSEYPHDRPDIPNVVVKITNLTTRNFPDVWYVGDYSDTIGLNDTTLTNYDGWVNGGYAFKIDRQGVNRPLVAESYAPANEIFEAGETWEFIIQDYSNMWNLAPSALGSVGVGWASGFPEMAQSSGSIVVPEPATMSLLGLGGLALLRRKRG